MATLKQIRDKANTRLTAFWAELVPAQDAYFAKHGKYFQKLITNRPVDGVEVDYLDVSPPGEQNPEDTTLITTGGKIPFALRIDEWTDKQNNAGWTATVDVELTNGDIYTRTRSNLNVDSGWGLYEEPLIN